MENLKLNQPEINFFLRVFLVAFASSLLLMGSALFLGTIGVDDEVTALETFYRGSAHRGLWGTELVTYLLPGQNGISFIPIFLGCMLYGFAITLLIYLWDLRENKKVLASSAIMGCFPYFASMMTFDVVQISYPLGFVFIVLSIFPVFSKNFNLLGILLGSSFFALAFSMYQGVATMVMTAFISTIGVHFITKSNKNDEFNYFWLRYLPRFLLIIGIGSVFYLLSVKVSKLIVPYKTFDNTYTLEVKLKFLEKNFFENLFNTIKNIFITCEDIPKLSTSIFIIFIFLISIRIFTVIHFHFIKKIIVLIIFYSFVFISPFWLMFFQDQFMTPRSSVGISFIYGLIFIGLTYKSSRKTKFAVYTLSFIWVLQFVFIGNEMYYAQHLMNQSEKININRMLARIDAIASGNNLSYPTSVTIIGKYSPGGKKFARYNTLGHSGFSWGDGNAWRQSFLFDTYGVEGLAFEFDTNIRNEVTQFIKSQKIPEWPNPSSVFLFQNKLIVVNFGGTPELQWNNLQSNKSKINK